MQAAYLVGVSDPNSSAGQKGLVDPAQFARANQSIQMACQNLVDPACTQSQVEPDPWGCGGEEGVEVSPRCVCVCVFQVLSAATIVAKHTSALCNACRLASSRTSNPVAKRQFVQSAKEVANTTANLVKSIKVRPPPLLRRTHKSSSHPVLWTFCRPWMEPSTRRTGTAAAPPLDRSSKLWTT